MHTFKVVKASHGWAVCMDEAMTMPFWTRAVAIQEANSLCAQLRRHGQAAEVLIEGIEPNPSLRLLRVPVSVASRSWSNRAGRCGHDR
jgi:hypothetical protein